MKEKKLTILLIAITWVLFLHLPYFILGKDAFILIHDKLDCEFMYLEILKRANLLFSFDSGELVDQIMGGLPRVYYHSEFSVFRLIFYVFNSFDAYIINSTLVRIIGFIGMYWLIRDYYKEMPFNLSLVLCAAYSSLSIYSLYGISIIGIPIVFWAFNNLFHTKKLTSSFILLSLFPFYSHFAMIAPFILVAIGVWFLYKTKCRYLIQYIWVIVGVFILTSSFILANIQTLDSFLFGEVLGHRSDRKISLLGFLPSAYLSIRTFFNAQYHGAPLFSIPIFLLACFVWICKRRRIENDLNRIEKIYKN